MKMRFIAASVALAAVALAGIAPLAAQAQNIAVVNGKAVPKSRVDALMSQVQKQATARGQQLPPEIDKLVRDKVVTDEILTQEAERRGLAASPEFKQQMDLARQSILIGLLSADVDKKTTISDADIQKEYDKFKAQASGTEYRARHILVEKEDDAKASNAWPRKRQPPSAMSFAPRRRRTTSSRTDPSRLDAQLLVAARGDGRIVRDEDERRPRLAVQLEHQLHHRLAGREIEAAGRLVGEQQRRPDDEGAGQRDALRRAAGEHARIVAQPLAEAHALEHLRRQRARIGTALQLERQHHVLERTEVAEQLEALKDEAEFGRAHGGARILVDGEEIDTGETNRAFARRIEPGDDREQGALAGTRRADDGYRALRLQGEIDVVENR